MSKIIKQYDENNNLIYHKTAYNYEWKYKYDKNSNLIYEKHSNGYECWNKYDKNNKLIYWKDSYGQEYYYKYDENNKSIEIIKQEFEETENDKKEKECNLRTKFTRFEIMDI